LLFELCFDKGKESLKATKASQIACAQVRFCAACDANDKN